jgi:hypothetical protein
MIDYLEPKLGLRERKKHTAGPVDKLATEAGPVMVYDLWLQ